MEHLAMGLILLLLGGACGGSFGLPSKFVSKETPWENLWAPFFLFATLFLPIICGPILAPGIGKLYMELGIAGIFVPILFGVLWGLGSVTLGLSFALIGLSLAYALNYGGQLIFGSLGPLLIHQPEKIAEASGIATIVGVLVCLGGVIICSWAGILKSRGQNRAAGSSENAATAAQTAKKMAVSLGMFVAFLSGAFCACWSIGASFGGNITDTYAAIPFEVSGWRNSIPVTALILFGGSFSACGFCAFKLFKNKTWSSFKRPDIARTLFIALFMAILHDSAVLFFGLGAPHLGDLGFAVGYPIFISFAIIIGNMNGFLTGEWRGAGTRAVMWILAGIAILIAGVSVLGYASTF